MLQYLMNDSRDEVQVNAQGRRLHFPIPSSGTRSPTSFPLKCRPNYLHVLHNHIFTLTELTEIHINAHTL